MAIHKMTPDDATRILDSMREEAYESHDREREEQIEMLALYLSRMEATIRRIASAIKGEE
jgi:hypothetical protein